MNYCKKNKSYGIIVAKSLQTNLSERFMGDNCCDTSILMVLKNSQLLCRPRMGNFLFTSGVYQYMV